MSGVINGQMHVLSYLCVRTCLFMGKIDDSEET